MAARDMLLRRAWWRNMLGFQALPRETAPGGGDHRRAGERTDNTQQVGEEVQGHGGEVGSA